MKILIDADAVPRIILEHLCRTSLRTGIPLHLVANKNIRFPPSPLISLEVVPQGIDIADDRIAELTEPDDLVITADIPLADRVITKGGYALNPRGELYCAINIKERLALRDLLNSLRDNGEISGGPAPFDTRAKERFANALDKFLARHLQRLKR